jgi:hypothetical protein
MVMINAIRRVTWWAGAVARAVVYVMAAPNMAAVL